MNTETHWEKIYSEKPSNSVSWYRPHLETSLGWIEKVAPSRSTSIIDVGGGESTLVDDLVARGCQNITVLDISQTAIDRTKKRLGSAANHVQWLAADITHVELTPCAYDLWHDRAVFHFLTTEKQRAAYVHQVARALKPGGHILMSTFGPEGPEKCSGLKIVRYNADSLHAEFGACFRLLESFTELHTTPLGGTQQFLYCLCRLE